jgi:hypothetical protein
MKQVLIHMNPESTTHLQSIGLEFKQSDGELDVIVDDVPYNSDHFIIDPDEQLCEHYGIDYDLVYCIEAL